MATKEILYKLGVKGAAKTNQQLGKTDAATKRLASSALKLAGAYLGVRGVYAALKSSTEAFIKQENAIRQLETAIGISSEGLQAFASNLQSVTTYGDEQILEAQALIGAFIREEDALKKATKATLDLAAAKGFDLRTAADLVGKTLGSSTNALTRYGIEVEGAAGSTERLQSMVENVDKAFGGMAVAMAQTTGGQLQQMKNVMGDLSEVLGEALAPTLTRVAQDMKTFVQYVFKLGGTSTATMDGLLPDDQAIAEKFGAIDTAWNDAQQSGANVIKIAKELGIEIKILMSAQDALNEIEKLRNVTLRELTEAQQRYNTHLAEQTAFLESNVGTFEAYAFALRKVNDEMEVQSLAAPEAISYIQDMNDVLSPEQSMAIEGLSQISNSLIQATIYGQKFGQAVVSSLKAIAAQLLSQAAVYMLMNLFTGGMGTGAASLKGFFNFASGASFTDSINLSSGTNNIGNGVAGTTIVNLNMGAMVGTNEQIIRDEVIPVIERSLASA